MVVFVHPPPPAPILPTALGPPQPCRHVPKGLVTNYGEGGLQNGRVWHVKFYPTKKGGGKRFSHAEGGAQKVLG